MRNALIEQIEQQYMKPDVAAVEVGDNVNVHVRIVKERVQLFSGVVIAIKGAGINQSIVVRRIVANEGVERTFPVHSPKVARIEVGRHAHTRRSKLYFLRERIGKARRLRDRRRDLQRAVVGHGRKAAPAGEPAEQSLQQAESHDAAKEIAHGAEPVQEEAGRKE
jgi:large subunit ribosomal protein L19